MSYNPAFVSDDLEGNVASSGSRVQQNGGIVLTSFKPIQRDDKEVEGKRRAKQDRSNINDDNNKRLHSDQANNVKTKVSSSSLSLRPTSSANKSSSHKQTDQTLGGLFVSTCSSSSLIDSSQQSSNNSYSFSISDVATTETTTSTKSSNSNGSVSPNGSTSSDSSSIISGSSLCAAVECRDMRYDVGRGKNQKTILHDINVTVPEGSIYGLLGPSGCGKTTMLRCVVGRIKPKSGYVRVFGYRPNQSGSRIPGPAIGYMPQVSSSLTYIN